MTFYWWSHWFWITSLSVLLLSMTYVQTYPSQEISLEYNQHSKPVKAVTKLYQATTTIMWPTTTTTASALITTPLTLSAIPMSDSRQFNEKIDESDGDVPDQETMPQENHVVAATADETSQPQELQHANSDAAKSQEENYSNVAQEQEDLQEIIDKGEQENDEHKRSAELNNKSDTQTAAETPRAAVNFENDEENAAVDEPHVAAVAAASVKLKRDGTAEVNNYTNYSSAMAASNRANSSNAATISNLGATASAPAAPYINSSYSNTHPPTASTREWLNAMAAAATAAAQLLSPTVRSTNANGEDRDMATAAQNPQAQRIPFTLENANKEEELRRAENEHRSRKSKVLSAEYKHINRYINYSADTKSLLTRSASTAPNDFDGVEESNISSEALAIQRTYFLDAGTISAICFTIFGVCCTVGTIGIVLYRRRYLNKPQALSEPDSSVYIDDSTMRDNSDEMYSLDNDSFLNSLEAMTIQNYWTDTVKHTKL